MHTPRCTPDLEPTDCPLCGCSDNSMVLQTIDYLYEVPGTYTISRCRKCGHRFMNPRPTAESLHLCYPESYAPHRPSPAVRGEESSAQPTPQPWYLRYLPLRSVPGLRSFYYWLSDDRGQPLPCKPERATDGRAPRAFELGCSTGSYLAKLTADGWDAVGVEPGTVAAETARESGFSVQTGTLDERSQPPAEYDCAAAWMVVEHLIDPLTTLRQLHDLLKPGGQLLISVPNAACWERVVFRSAWYVWEPPRHLQYFTPSGIRAALRTVGFAEVKVVHQRNVLYIIGSLGILLSRFSLTRGIGRRLLRYPDAPQMWVQLALSPLAHLLALLRQSGRLTILAERPPTISADRKQQEADS